MNYSIFKRIWVKLFPIFFAIILLSTPIKAQHTSLSIDSLFERIRNSEVMLHLFFSQMPKGGDLHNHLSGSIYAESHFDIGCRSNFWLDTLTYQMAPHQAENRIMLSENMTNKARLKSECIDYWSIRNYDFNRTKTAQDKFFFGTFRHFGATIPGHLEEFIKEVRMRAQNEHVSYLEIYISSPPVLTNMLQENTNKQIKEYMIRKDTDKLNKCLSEMYEIWEQDKTVQQSIAQYVRTVDSLHNASKSVAPEIVTCYQTYAERNREPIRVFAQLYMAHKACTLSDILVGVNIFQPEDNEIALRDYWGHMSMFGFLSSAFNETEQINTSVHAGELVLGMVPPEDLSNHIHDAVTIGKAKRIGHGVDIAFETSALDLLKRMKAEQIAVEINLTSNEFILGIKDDAHPIMLYHKSGVPLVLSTDDAGILRTTLSHQFVLAAQRYPELTYSDLKKFIFNSIDYSFAPHSTKKKLRDKLVQDILVFETKMLEELPVW